MLLAYRDLHERWQILFIAVDLAYIFIFKKYCKILKHFKYYIMYMKGKDILSSYSLVTLCRFYIIHQETDVRYGILEIRDQQLHSKVENA